MSIPLGYRFTGAGLKSKQRAARRVARQYRREAAEARVVHGHARRGSENAAYRIWIAMRTRCSPQAKGKSRRLYFLRGIRVCARWQSFEAFLADMGPRPSRDHSIERKDGNRDYEPANCVWALPRVQARNTRSNRMVPYGSKMVPLIVFCERIGASYGAVHARLRRGWTIDQIRSHPGPANNQTRRALSC